MLNEKQSLFALEYIKDLNITQAYIRAGYTESGAQQNGLRLFNTPDVQAEIARLMEIRGKEAKMTADDVFKELVDIAKDDMRNYVEFDTRTVIRKDAQGTPYPEDIVNITVKDSAEISTKNIKSISRGKDGQFKFELYSRDNALKLLADHLGMFTQKIAIENALDISKLSTEDKIKYLEMVNKMKG